MNRSLWHGTDQLDFVFNIKHYVVEGPKYSGNNAANFIIYICNSFFKTIIVYLTEIVQLIP